MKNDEFHTIFTLRQHTPMIHFQAEHTGALLRTSELKPAFDKYLRQRVFGDDFNRCKRFLVGYAESREDELRAKFAMSRTDDNDQAEGECAFDYKVSIQFVETHLDPIAPKQAYPCFFGSLGDSTDDDRNRATKWTLLMAKKEFTVQFFCLQPELLQFIKDKFAAFMSRKNFGTRQSKGFGSFTVVDDNGVSISALHTAVYTPMNLLSFSVKVRREAELFDKIKDVFTHIDIFWKVVRNGFDIEKIKDGLGEYVRSDSNQQQADWRIKGGQRLVDGNVEADKTAIRTFVNSVKKYGNVPEQTNPLLFRDLLGLASTTDWKEQSIVLQKTHTESDESKKIHRFKSPVTFKPVKVSDSEYQIFIILQAIPADFFGKQFKLSVEPKKADRVPSLMTEYATPPSFSLTKFFTFIQKEYKAILSDVLAKEAKNSKYLKQVFNTLTIHTQPRNA